MEQLKRELLRLKKECKVLQQRLDAKKQRLRNYKQAASHKKEAAQQDRKLGRSENSQWHSQSLSSSANAGRKSRGMDDSLLEFEGRFVAAECVCSSCVCPQVYS